MKSRLPARNRSTATSSAAISAVVARCPIRPASRAIRSAGNRPSSGARKSRRPAATRSTATERRWAAIGVCERVLDGESHVRGAQLGLEGAVDEPDGGVNDALRVDHHLDRVVVDIVQPVRLDHLQALVRERRRVDRDLRSHRPGRVAEGLLRADAGEVRGLVEERAAGRRQDEGVDARHATPRRGTARSRSARSRSGGARRAGSRTDPSAVRAATRAARSRASGITRWPPATSVSLLAVATTLPAASAATTGREADDAARPDDDEVDVVAGRQRHQRIVAALRARSRAAGQGPRPASRRRPRRRLASGGAPARRGASCCARPPARRRGTRRAWPRGRRASGGRSNRSSR